MKILAFGLLGLALIACTRLAEAAPITKLERQQCQSDYKQYCGGTRTLHRPALRTCMDKNKNICRKVASRR